MWDLHYDMFAINGSYTVRKVPFILIFRSYSLPFRLFVFCRSHPKVLEKVFIVMQSKVCNQLMKFPSLPSVLEYFSYPNLPFFCDQVWLVYVAFFIVILLLQAVKISYRIVPTISRFFRTEK